MASILVPVLYLFVLVTGLVVFGRVYRKRVAARIRREPWFPVHPERDTYVSLLQLSDPPASDTLLKAALIRRAVADVHRIIRVRDDKAALSVLLQKGSISDDLWNSFLIEEKELEAEIVEVVAEANTFLEGWGQAIFQTASEIVQNEKLRETLIKAPQQKAELEAKYGGTIKNRIKTASSLAAPLSTTPSSSRPASPGVVTAVLTPNPTASEILPPNLPTSPATSSTPSTPISPKTVSSGKKGFKKRR